MALTFRVSCPIGVVLAGGDGRRIGGGKACAELLGAPLISYPRAALRAVLSEVVVVAKPSTALPVLPGTQVWLEPEEPQHPLLGIVSALERAAGRSVLVCAVDLPLVGQGLVTRLARARAPLAAIAADRDGPQPLLGRYEPGALAPLREALAEQPPPRMRSLSARLDANHVPTDDEHELLNVNHPEDLRRAASELGRRAAQPNVKA